jgi:hypothetical protein
MVIVTDDAPIFIMRGSAARHAGLRCAIVVLPSRHPVAGPSRSRRSVRDGYQVNSAPSSPSYPPNSALIRQ